MALQKQYLDLFYGISGISQKPDPKVLESPQMAVIENAICERPGRLELRPGYRTEIMPSSDGPAYEPYRIALRDKRPVAFTQNRGKITEYVNEAAEDYDSDHWHTIETERHARSSERTIYSFQDYRPEYVDSIIVGDYLCVTVALAWNEKVILTYTGKPVKMVLMIFDKNTYQYITTETIVDSANISARYDKIKLLPSPTTSTTIFYMVYSYFDGANNQIRFNKYDLSTFTNTYCATIVTTDQYYAFDVVTYQSASNVYFWTIYREIATGYTEVARVSTTSPYPMTQLNISGLGSGTILSFTKAIGINSSYDTLAFIFETAVGIYLGFCPTDVSTLSSSLLLKAVADYTTLWRATITYSGTRWYMLYEASYSGYFDIHYVYSFAYQGSSKVYSYTYWGINLQHKATPYSEETGSRYGYYVGLQDQDTLEGTNYTAVGIPDDYDLPFGFGTYMKLAPIAQFQTYSAPNANDYWFSYAGFVTSIHLISTGIYKWLAVSYQEYLGEGDFATKGEFGLVVNELDLTTNKLMQPFNYQRILFLASSMPHEYDGSIIGDIGLIPRPVIIEANVVAHSSRAHYMASGDYNYIVVFERRDSYGNIFRSRPSLVSSVTVGAETYPSVQLIIEPFVGNFYTDDRSWRAVVYRTKAGPQDIYYRTEIDIELSSSYVDDQSYRRTSLIYIDDTLDDASLENNNYLYITGGVLENYACPPTNYITKHQSRIWAINSANGDIWYSKELITGEGPAFSPAFVVSNPEADIPEAIQSLNETALVVFWPHKIGIIYGEGPNDLGQGGSYTVPQMLPGNVGAIDWRSVVKTEIGVFFQSAKGIYLLPLDSGRAQYIGAGVELYRDSTIYSADVIENRHQVRLLAENYTTSSNRDILIYDYLIQQWHIWPDVMSEAGGIIDSIDYNGAHALLHADGISVQDSDWSNSIFPYTDYYDYSAANGPSVYAMKVVTPWVKLAGLQGFQRVWRVLILGEFTEYTHPHDLTVELYYDYVENDYAKDTVSIPWATIQQSAANNFLYQFRVGVPHQRCEAIKVKVTVSQYDEENPKRMVTLTGLRFEYGIMPRSMRLPKYPPVG